MKNINSKIFFLSLLIGLASYSTKADAFSFFDPGSGASQAINTINETAGKVETFVNDTVKGNLNEIKSTVDGYVSDFSLKKKESKIPGTKDIVESKIAKNNDETAVKAAIHKIAFSYTSPMEIEQRKYNAKGQELYEDVVIEAATAVDNIEKDLILIDQQIATAITDSSNAEDYNKTLYNSYKMDLATDQVLSRIQELMAINAQLIAARAIADEVEPLYYGPANTGIKFN